jgi:hypothetical protein
LNWPVASAIVEVQFLRMAGTAEAQLLAEGWSGQRNMLENNRVSPSRAHLVGAHRQSEGGGKLALRDLDFYSS